jgi:hypothetical protein
VTDRPSHDQHEVSAWLAGQLRSYAEHDQEEDVVQKKLDKRTAQIFRGAGRPHNNSSTRFPVAAVDYSTGARYADPDQLRAALAEKMKPWKRRG